MKIQKLLSLFLALFMSGLSFSSISWAEESSNPAQTYSFTLPAGQSPWQSEKITNPQAFDFVAFETNSFAEHLDLEIKVTENGAEIWRELDLHNEYGEGLEGMMTVSPTNTLELRYQGTALKTPVQISVHLFPVQKNQGLAKNFLPSANSEMGGNENMPVIIPRSAWGADESMRLVDRSTGGGGTYTDPCAASVEKYPQDFKISYEASDPGEFWERDYSDHVDHLVVHHTTTANTDVSAPAIVRSIYQYHTVTRAWGDIGYNYLIDTQGNIYEGRYGGEHNGLPVVGGHALCSNRNTIGIALMMDAQNNPVPGPMLDALSDLTAYFSDKYQLDPLGQNLWHGEMKYTIGGHKDFQSTACPGTYMYDLLPKVREATELKLKSNYSTEFDANNLPYNAEAVLKEKSLNLNPNQQQTLEVEFKNTGTQPWSNQTWLYGVASSEPIANPLLIDKPFVLANIKQKEVAPGAVGSFQLNLQAPFQAGEHVLYMVPVLDNKVKISRAAMTLKIKVNEPVLNYEVIKQNAPSGEIKVGAVLKDPTGSWYSIQLKNTGNSTWLQKNTTLNASGPQGRSSVLSGGPIMARLSQTQVVPGEEGEFVFQGLQAPLGQAGEKIEQFTPVIEDAKGVMHWMPDQALGFQITIVGGSTSLFSANLLQTLPTFSATEKPFRVKLSYAPAKDQSTVVTSSQEFYLRHPKGGPYLKLPANATVDLKQWNKVISFSTSEKQKALVSALQIIPSEGGILEIRSWEHRPSWNQELNDNQFRGTLEFRVNEKDRSLLTINELPLEDYMKGIAEVSNNDPTEKQNTMAVIARSYAEFYRQAENRKFPNAPYDGSDDPDVFQKYLGYGLEKRSPNWVKAVQKTTNQVVKYNGKVVKTPYFNQTGEGDRKTLSAKEVWGWDNTPYLVSVSDEMCKSPGPKAGHGVGLSGCGATAMAEAGKNFVEIIQYYYTGVEVGRLG